MDGAAVKRLSAIAGGCVFILALLAQLARPNLGIALLTAMACGLVVGAVSYAAGMIAILGRPPASASPAPSADAAIAGGTAEGEAGEKAGPEEAKRSEPEVAGDEGDLQQTVRLDEAGLDKLVPGMTAEEIQREVQSLEKAMAEEGIEERPEARENINEESRETPKGGNVSDGGN